MPRPESQTYRAICGDSAASSAHDLIATDRIQCTSGRHRVLITDDGRCYSAIAGMNDETTYVGKEGQGFGWCTLRLCAGSGQVLLRYGRT